MDYTSSIFDVIEPTAKIMEIASKSKAAIRFATRAGFVVGVVGGTLDAAVSFLDAYSEYKKGNQIHRRANIGKGVGNILMVVGTFLLLGGGTAFIGAIIIVIGVAIILACEAITYFVEKYDEVLIWLRHCKFGVCYSCGSQCPQPKLTEVDCKYKADAYKWTRYVTKIKTVKRYIRNDLGFGGHEYEEVEKEYSGHYWFKSAKEHAESYKNLMLEVAN